MSTPRDTLAPLMGTERVACVLRLAVGLLTLLMTVQFEALASWLAVAATVTAVGWSVLMFIALRSDLSPDQVGRLANWSHWFDIVLALVVYATFLPDPQATPVAGLPLLAYRLALRHGTAGVVAGAVTFVSLVAGRITFTRVTEGELLARPPMLMAWSLVAVLVLVLAVEARARAAAAQEAAAREATAALEAAEAREAASAAEAANATPGAVGASTPPLPVTAPSTGDERLDTLAACLSLKLETPPPVRLTERELEVLLLLGQGHAYGAIASRLFISQSTVRNHVHNLRTKLGLEDRGEMLTLARAVAARAEYQPEPSSPPNTSPDSSTRDSTSPISR